MTTPNKCEHPVEDLTDNEANGGLRCLTCGARFIPSDVLEELMETLLTIQNHTTEPPTEKLASEAMARIDAVLGKK